MKDSSHPSLQRFLNVLNPVRGFGASFKDRVWSGRRRGGSSPFRIVGWKKWPCHGDVAVLSPQYAGNTAFFSNFLFSPFFSLAGFMAEAFSCAFRWDFKKQEPVPMAQP